MCPDCRAFCKCVVREISEGIHFYDEYTFYCSNCGKIKAKDKVYKGSTISGIRTTQCPFCGAKSKDHSRTPKELLANPATSKQDFLFYLDFLK
jgi:rubrerythrin